MALVIGSGQHPVIGLLGLLPLIHVCQVSTPERALVAGGVWGAALYVFSALFGQSLVERGVGSIVLLTLVPATDACFGAWVTRRVGFKPFVLALGWLLVELALRPVVLGQGLLAGTQSHTLLVSIGSVLGYGWVAFAVVFLMAWTLRVAGCIELELSWPDPAETLREALSTAFPILPALRPIEVIEEGQSRAPPRRW